MNMSRLLLLANLLAATSGSTTSTPASRELHRSMADDCVQYYHPPNIRYPPAPLSNLSVSLNDDNGSTQPWLSPPQSYLWSPWHFTYSTRPRYLTLTNMQAIHYPIMPSTSSFPSGTITDLVSWSTNPNDTSDHSVTTVFGYFCPLTFTHIISDNNGSAVTTLITERVPAVWNYSSTGPLADTTNFWAILAYGIDDRGVGYRVDYESGYYVQGGNAANERPCINIASQDANGPSERVYRDIVNGLVSVGERVGDMNFVKLVGSLGRIKSDERGMHGWTIDCDEACVDNAGLVPGK